MLRHFLLHTFEVSSLCEGLLVKGKLGIVYIKTFYCNMGNLVGMLHTGKNIFAAYALHIVNHSLVKFKGILLVVENKAYLIAIDIVVILAVQVIIQLVEVVHRSIIVFVTTAPCIGMNAVADRDVGILRMDSIDGGHLARHIFGDSHTSLLLFRITVNTGFDTFKYLST